MKTITELKSVAFQIPTDGLATYFPQWNSEEFIFPQSRKKSVFNTNNNICTFIDEEGMQFVIPYFSGLLDILSEEGLKTDEGIYVPFSNWDYPRDYNLLARWNNTRQAIA